MRMLMLVVLISLVAPSMAHEDPHWTTADRKWFKEQMSPKTGQLCCDHNDGSEAEEQIRGDNYWARWKMDNKTTPWMLVPDDVVIREPNRNGAPVVWWTFVGGNLQIKCYAPGGGV